MATQIFYHDKYASSLGAIYFYHDKYSASAGAINFYHDIFIPYGTKWDDINCEIRTANGSFYDINCDIRVVSTHTVIRDINTDIRLSQRMFYDVRNDIRVVDSYLKTYDINADIRVTNALLYNINCDIRTISQNEVNYNIDCDIRVISSNIHDLACDIRIQENTNKIYDINCDIRVKQANPKGLDYFRVYLNSVEIEDVEIESLNYEWTKNESPASASFRVVRKSDDFNKTLDNLSQSISTDTPVEIKFDGKLRYYGYVMSLDVEQSGESVIVNCLDRKQKINEQLYDISFGKKWEFPEQGQLEVVQGDYPRTGQAIVKILDDLVTAGIISSYSGVPIGFMPEYQEDKGTPAGQLITDLLDESGNYYWNVTPYGVLEIYEAGNGRKINLPSQKIDKQIHLYEIVNYSLKLNDRTNLITTVEVNMGTESEDTRASYKRCSISASKTSGTRDDFGEPDTIGNVAPAWDRSYDGIYNQYYGSQEELQSIKNIKEFRLFYDKFGEDEKAQEVGRKWRLGSWTEGSFIDDTFESFVIGFNNYKISGWSWNGEYLTLSAPLITVKKFETRKDNFYAEYGFKAPSLFGVFYRKEDVSVATYPTIFDITWIGIGGAGAKRKITLSQLGIKEAIGWTVYENGQLVSKSEPGFDDTAYATDRARLMLSKINDPLTEGTIDLTFDAFEYYGLNLGNKVNISQTNESNIYNENNGFPLDIESITFRPSNYTVTLNVVHIRPYTATINFR